MVPCWVLLEARGEEKIGTGFRGGGNGLKGIGLAPRVRVDGVDRGLGVDEANGAGEEGNEYDCRGKIDPDISCAPCNGVGD